MLKSVPIFLFALLCANCSNSTEPKPPDNEGHTVTINNLQKVTGEGYHPRWSPGGDMIVYTVWNNSANKTELWILEIATEKKYPIIQNIQGDLSPDWSPDGSKIIFDGYDPEGVSQIWTYELSTASVTKLTSFSSPAFSPSYSNDADKITFIYSGYIYTKDLAAGILFKIPGTENANSPEWSSDNSKIIYAYDPLQNNISDIYIINTDGTQKKQLTNYGGRDGRPRFSPDGKFFVYEYFADDKIHPAFYFMDNGEIIINKEIPECNMPDISSDGNKIAFTKRDGIYIANLSVD